MTDSLSRIYGPAQPGTSTGVLYTAPVNTTAVVRNIHVMNTTGVAATINLAVNGTAATAANCFLYQYTVPANSTYDWSGVLPIAEAETLDALQGTSGALTVVISGVLVLND